MRSSPNDARFIKETFTLAKKAAGRTNPNPLVGALIVQNGRIIGRGYHRGPGTPHGEIQALQAAKGRTRGATAYVNLEPCAHFGRTPPCADALIKAGISRVVCATRDPNPLAAGGIEKLKKAGIRTSVGILEEEARQLNETFFTYHEKKRPYVVLKFALSLDGKLATRIRDSKWITNEKARAYTRKLRGSYQGILVGIETVLADDPHLGAGGSNARDPVRIILDSDLRIPFGAQVLRDKNVIIATTAKASRTKISALKARGFRLLTFAGERISIKRLLAALHKENILSVMVEGGGTILGSFIDSGAVDKVFAFYAPLLIGGEKAVTIGGAGRARVIEALRLKNVSVRSFGDNVLITGAA